jgi:glucose/arabinose dehydrogenase
MRPDESVGGAFVALHGSWNRASRTGCSVVHIPSKNGKPTGGYRRLSHQMGSRSEGRTACGRPAGLLILRDGSLLVTDDGAGVICRMSDP